MNELDHVKRNKKEDRRQRVLDRLYDKLASCNRSLHHLLIEFPFLKELRVLDQGNDIQREFIRTQNERRQMKSEIITLLRKWSRDVPKHIDCHGLSFFSTEYVIGPFNVMNHTPFRSDLSDDWLTYDRHGNIVKASDNTNMFASWRNPAAAISGLTRGTLACGRVLLWMLQSCRTPYARQNLQSGLEFLTQQSMWNRCRWQPLSRQSLFGLSPPSRFIRKIHDRR